MAERLFTLQEAEELIPQLEKIFDSLMENKQMAIQLGRDLSDLQEQVQSGRPNAVSAHELLNKKTELEFLVKIINEGLESIEDLGGQPKDLDLGLVDFPTIVDGEEVLLCWKYGEKSIRYYHGYYEGYAGRKPLSEEL